MIKLGASIAYADQQPRSNWWVASVEENRRRPWDDGDGDHRLNDDRQSHTRINNPNHIGGSKIGKTKGAGPLHIAICDCDQIASLYQNRVAPRGGAYA